MPPVAAERGPELHCIAALGVWQLALKICGLHAESKGVCAVKSPGNGDTVQLSTSLCGGGPDAGKDISTYVTDSLARMWNISQEASDTA